MVFSVRNVLCLTILAVLASTGYAIHCYVGDTISNRKCGENFDAVACELIDCNRVVPPDFARQFSKNATGCMKQSVQFQSRFSIIERHCYFGDVSNKQGCQLYKDVIEGKMLTCDVCTEDGCNGSASLAPIAGAIILFFGVVRLLA